MTRKRSTYSIGSSFDRALEDPKTIVNPTSVQCDRYQDASSCGLIGLCGQCRATQCGKWKIVTVKGEGQ